MTDEDLQAMLNEPGVPERRVEMDGRIVTIPQTKRDNCAAVASKAAGLEVTDDQLAKYELPRRLFAEFAMDHETAMKALRERYEFEQSIIASWPSAKEPDSP